MVLARVRFRTLAIVAAATLATACGADDGGGADADLDGTVGGRILITQDGPLVGAAVSIDLLEYLGATPMVRSHVGDVTTDATGHFEHPTGTGSGYFLITARGGQFRDYATGQAVVLDPTDELTAILYTDSLEDLTTGLITPEGHLAYELIKARTASGADPSLVVSHTLVNEHLDAHFGGLHWERIAPASLDASATSPTAEVRAAFILAAWSLVARDIAAASGASAQEVNPYSLGIELAKDLAAPPFDGNDGNNRAGGTGVQLGACPPPDGACVPAGTCDLGACRTACDAYAGTPRTTLAAAVTYLINDSARNHTGLTTADTLSFVRAMATNPDALLFGDACVDEVDHVAPGLTWGATPADGAVVRGAVAWTVHATDNVDPHPVVTLGGGLVDTDGAPDGAATSIDTSSTDRVYDVTATATDAAGNSVTETRSVVADNTAPVLTVAATGFLVDGATWWTASAAPHLTGTVSDLHGPVTIEARVLGQVVASASVAGGAWDLPLPAGSIAATGSTVAIRAVDAPGNATVDGPTTSPTLRVDSDGPSLDALARTFIDESKDIVTPGATGPAHSHSTNAADAVTLGGPAAPPVCPTIRKYAYRTAAAPVGSESVPNPVALAFRASDAGVGLDPTGASYTIQAPDGQVSPAIPLGTTLAAPGVYDSVAMLTRDVFPPIGDPAQVQEGVFTITFTARDRLGLSSSIMRCFTYAPMGPPLLVVNGPREAVSNTYVKTLAATYALPSGPTSEVLNGTATAGVLELWVTNSTPDPAYVTAASSPPPAGTYTKQIVTYLEPTTQQTVSSPLCDVVAPPPGEDPLCTGYSPTPLATVNASGAIAGWAPYVGYFQINATGNAIAGLQPACPECATDQRKIGPGEKLAIVGGAAGISDLVPDAPGPYREVAGDFTGAAAPGAPTIKQCISWSPQVGTTRYCTRIQNYRQNRVLQAFGVTLNQGGSTSVRLETTWESRARPPLLAGAPSSPAIARDLRTLISPYVLTTVEN